LYHDPEKEAKEERLRKIKAESGLSNEPYSPGIQRGTMKNYYRKDVKAPKQSNIRLIIIICFLLLLAYLLLFR
jgi:hypothetical protein